jgi:hypothetical protein
MADAGSRTVVQTAVQPVCPVALKTAADAIVNERMFLPSPWPVDRNGSAVGAGPWVAAVEVDTPNAMS